MQSRWHGAKQKFSEMSLPSFSFDFLSVGGEQADSSGKSEAR